MLAVVELFDIKTLSLQTLQEDARSMSKEVFVLLGAQHILCSAARKYNMYNEKWNGPKTKCLVYRKDIIYIWRCSEKGMNAKYNPSGNNIWSAKYVRIF